MTVTTVTPVINEKGTEVWVVNPADLEQFLKEVTEDAGPRSLRQIARDVRAHWPKVYFGAVPYLDAMSCLDKVTDSYGCDSAASIVAYFLSNATTWRGPDARRVKAELKTLLKEAS